jgi:hypothetical protein
LKEFVGLTVETICAEDIKYISAKRDVIVLFDKPFDNLLPAPVTPSIVPAQRVHLMGYATFDHQLKTFLVPGEVTNVSIDSFMISCLTIPGLSGAGFVCDQSKHIIGYSGGAVAGSDKSSFGSYAYPLS